MQGPWETHTWPGIPEPGGSDSLPDSKQDSWDLSKSRSPLQGTKRPQPNLFSFLPDTFLSGEKASGFPWRRGWGETIGEGTEWMKSGPCPSPGNWELITTRPVQGVLASPALVPISPDSAGLCEEAMMKGLWVGRGKPDTYSSDHTRRSAKRGHWEWVEVHLKRNRQYLLYDHWSLLQTGPIIEAIFSFTSSSTEWPCLPPRGGKRWGRAASWLLTIF